MDRTPSFLYLVITDRRLSRFSPATNCPYTVSFIRRRKILCPSHFWLHSTSYRVVQYVNTHSSRVPWVWTGCVIQLLAYMYLMTPVDNCIKVEGWENGVMAYELRSGLGAISLHCVAKIYRVFRLVVTSPSMARRYPRIMYQVQTQLPRKVLEPKWSGHHGSVLAYYNWKHCTLATLYIPDVTVVSLLEPRLLVHGHANTTIDKRAEFLSMVPHNKMFDGWLLEVRGICYYHRHSCDSYIYDSSITIDRQLLIW